MDSRLQIKMTCFEAHYPVASVFISALPSFIERFYPKGTETWIPSHCDMDTCSSDFEMNNQGQWTGNWTSPDDNILAAMVASDRAMGMLGTTTFTDAPLSTSVNPFHRPMDMETFKTPTVPAMTIPPPSANVDSDDSQATIASRQTTASMFSSQTNPPAPPAPTIAQDPPRQSGNSLASSTTTVLSDTTNLTSFYFPPTDD
jgi:hypothetical protein